MMDAISREREGSTDGSLSSKSSLSVSDKGATSLSPMDVSSLPGLGGKSKPGLAMPLVDRRDSKPVDRPSVDPSVLYVDNCFTVPFPKSLSRWMDPRDCTVVGGPRMDYFASYARFIASVRSVPEGPEVLKQYEDERCLDLEICRACYPTEATIRSALSVHEERPVCIHRDTKFSMKLRPWLGLFEVKWEGERFFYYSHKCGKPETNSSCGGPGIDFFAESFFIVPGRGRGVVIQRFMKALEVVHYRCQERPITEERAIRIYRWSHGRSDWERKMTVKGRSLESVIIPKHHIDRITKDLDRFFAKETAEWYEEHGLPYKRSLLFHGLPGTGKTSLITALAAKYQRNVCFLQPQHPRFTDDLFKTCMEYLPRRAIVILEDVDSLFEGREKAAGSSCPLTFSGLLNALDGITYESGCIFVMTTNHVEKLDPALVRAGRCDIKIPFTVATDWQLARFFQKFYKDSDEDTQQLFVKNTRTRFPKGVTLAELQQHFIDVMFADAQTAAEAVLDYCVVPKDEPNHEKEKGDDSEEEEKGDDSEVKKGDDSDEKDKGDDSDEKEKGDDSDEIEKEKGDDSDEKEVIDDLVEEPCDN